MKHPLAEELPEMHFLDQAFDESTLKSSPPLLLTAVEAATACRTSVRTWRTWDAAGRVPRPINIGRAKLWRPLELVDWVAAGCPPRAQWEWESRVPAA